MRWWYLFLSNWKQCWYWNPPYKKDIVQAESVIDYFKEILKRTGEISFDIPAEEAENKNSNLISSEILLKALDGIDLLESRSALSNYIDGTNPTVSTTEETLIFPFECNESQKLAVETTLRNSISIVFAQLSNSWARRSKLTVCSLHNDIITNAINFIRARLIFSPKWDSNIRLKF